VLLTRRAHLSAPFPNLQPPLLRTKPQPPVPTISVCGSVSAPRARPSKGSVTPSTPFPSPVSPRSHSLEHPRKPQRRPTGALSAPPRRSSSPSCLDSIYSLGELRLASIFLLMPSFSRMVASRAVFASSASPLYGRPWRVQHRAFSDREMHLIEFALVSSLSLGAFHLVNRGL
jgi:hypothetical protein